jgi:lysozyme
MNKPDIDDRKLRNDESLRLKKYKCSAGHWTIGFGHKLAPGEDYPDGITREKAEELFWADVAGALAEINRLCPGLDKKINRNQRTALISLVFNCGGAPLAGTPGKLLRAGKFEDAAKSFTLYQHGHGKGVKCQDAKGRYIYGCNGLLARRKRERDLFLLPVIPPVSGN